MKYVRNRGRNRFIRQRRWGGGGAGWIGDGRKETVTDINKSQNKFMYFFF